MTASVKNLFKLSCLIIWLIVVYSLIPSHENQINKILLMLGLLLIALYLIYGGNSDIFEPFYLFSIYYSLLYFSAINLSHKKFDNVYLNHVNLYSSVEDLYTLTLIVILIGFIFTFLGAKIIKLQNNPVLKIKKLNFNSPYIRIMIYILYLIGFINFIWNIFIFYNGNVYEFYVDFANRASNFVDSGTTLYYNFLYVSAYMMFIAMLEKNKIDFFKVLLIIISFLIFISNARIVETIFYFASFFVIYYYNNKSRQKLNIKFLLLGIILSCFAILIYFLRIQSSLISFQGGSLLDFLGVSDNLFDIFIFNIFEKGNVPNFPVLMKIIDSCGRDLGYFYGATLLSPLYNFISPNFYGLIEIPAVITKNYWYADFPGGNIPITIVGEMVLNFSLYFFPIGMFFFGLIGSFFYMKIFEFKSNLYIIFYAKFIFHYMFSPKGEMNNFSIFWMAFPALVIIIIFLLIRLLKFNQKNELFCSK